MKFTIEQIAICPPDREAALELLKQMGGSFVHDVVVAEGEVRGSKPCTNVAKLAFDYNLGKESEGALADGIEFEVLNYTAGDNWMNQNPASVSHLAMHCTAGELGTWKRFFRDKRIGIVQEVRTLSHTNDYVVSRRRHYHYCIFETRPILGVDLKFIVRVDPTESAE